MNTFTKQELTKILDAIKFISRFADDRATRGLHSYED